MWEAKKPSDDQPKQTTGESGEFEHKPPPKSKYLKGNEALISKGKGNITDDDEDLSKGAKLKQKKHDQEIDEALRIAKEAEAREKEAREAQVTLETQKSFFPT
ncbi:unnamed protein product [Lactuca saligna]|uniref:Uncharacterized protein n=1 Tax=Lactuca saligna TaxID=75948 RepID=A0AA35ZRQ4_LACSI|nr:unnamed protein product [Lactuca saligna]